MSKNIWIIFPKFFDSRYIGNLICLIFATVHLFFFTVCLLTYYMYYFIFYCDTNKNEFVNKMEKKTQIIPKYIKIGIQFMKNKVNMSKIGDFQIIYPYRFIR